MKSLQARAKGIVSYLRRNGRLDEVNEYLSVHQEKDLSVADTFKLYMLVKHMAEGCRYYQKYTDEGLFEFNFTEKHGWFDFETDTEDTSVVAVY